MAAPRQRPPTVRRRPRRAATQPRVLRPAATRIRFALSPRILVPTRTPRLPTPHRRADTAAVQRPPVTARRPAALPVRQAMAPTGATNYNAVGDRYSASASTTSQGSNTGPIVDRYSTPATSATNGYNSSGASAYGADAGQRYGSTSNTNSGLSGTDATASGDRYGAPIGGAAPLIAARPASPNAVAPVAGAGGYTPPSAAYIPASTGASSSTNTNTVAPEADRYAPPGGFSAPPASSTSSGSSDTGYRPGSTSSYSPSSPSTISAVPNTLPGVTPAGYTSPVGSGM